MIGAISNDVVCDVRGRVGRILLNRPKAINALTHDMVTIVASTLEDWADDPAVQTVLIRGAGDRGLCAGGDIVALYEDALRRGGAAAAFWADEYRMNSQIATYPKPVVSFMDGLVLGGGIGIAAHASHRVVTERSKLGMPETGIGFLPDVGGTWLLSHAPGELGTHLGLTAGSVGPGDAIALALADVHVPSTDLEALARDLETEDASHAIARWATGAADAALPGQRSWIDACYCGDDIRAIVAALELHPDPAAQKAAVAIRAKSPTSLAVTLAALRTAAGAASLDDALTLELRAAVRLHQGHDFTEGVRAQVIDKDRNPQWDPPTIDDLPPGLAATYLVPLEDDLDLFPLTERASR